MDTNLGIIITIISSFFGILLFVIPVISNIYKKINKLDLQIKELQKNDKFYKNIYYNTNVNNILYQNLTIK